MHVTKKLLRNLLALIIAAITTYIIGAVISSIFVLKALPAKIPFGTYVSTALSDITNLKLYLVIILIGFLIAFPIAAALRKALRKTLPKLAKIGYPLAGAAAIGAALGLMYLQFETVPISGANNAFGFIMQLVTGALGGAIFAKLQTPIN